MYSSGLNSTCEMGIKRNNRDYTRHCILYMPFCLGIMVVKPEYHTKGRESINTQCSMFCYVQLHENTFGIGIIK